METPGYRIKLHSALITPILIAGAPRQFAILNGTFCAAMVLGLRAYYMLPIFLLFHIIAVIFTKRDPYFFEVMLRHLHKKKYYGI